MQSLKILPASAQGPAPSILRARVTPIGRLNWLQEKFFCFYEATNHWNLLSNYKPGSRGVGGWKENTALNSFCDFFSPITRPWLRRSPWCRDPLGEEFDQSQGWWLPGWEKGSQCMLLGLCTTLLLNNLAFFCGIHLECLQRKHALDWVINEKTDWHHYSNRIYFQVWSCFSHRASAVWRLNIHRHVCW